MGIRSFSVILAVASVLSGLLTTRASALDDMHGPTVAGIVKKQEEYGAATSGVLDLYQRWISPVNGESNCPMHPSCSQYSKLTFIRHSPLKAYALSCERLLRCGRDYHYYPRVMVDGRMLSYDPLPVEEQTFALTTDSEFRSPEQKSEKPEPDTGFADFLRENGEYYRAITEYYRELHGESDPKRRAAIFSRIGRCYYEGGDYEQCISFVEINRQALKIDGTSLSEMELYRSKSYYSLGRYTVAITNLEWNELDTDDPHYYESQFIIGLSYARISDLNASLGKMRAIPPESDFYPASNRLLEYEDRFDKLPRKKPGVAGFLSALIPGAGYIYSGRYSTGVASLLINGLIGWTISDAINKEQYGLSSTTMFFGLGWYIGNIKGSADAARRHNSVARHRLIDDILKQEDMEEFVRRHKQ
ncbi:MAG: membrane protein insertion efficiency factor YidD [Bacteroidales bacterium]|nr:membrane protein insertion efficiency factor YidD [Candidatus Latescibacterota bacterium]